MDSKGIYIYRKDHMTESTIKAPIPNKACGRFGLSCSYCKQGAPHPSPQESDWSSKDWVGTKAKAKEETNSLTDQ